MDGSVWRPSVVCACIYDLQCKTRVTIVGLIVEEADWMLSRFNQGSCPVFLNPGLLNIWIMARPMSMSIFFDGLGLF